jgi:hypothetical protein
MSHFLTTRYRPVSRFRNNSVLQLGFYLPQNASLAFVDIGDTTSNQLFMFLEFISLDRKSY